MHPDDVPLLLGLMKQLGFPAILDRHLGNHGNHHGISNGWLTAVWLSYIPSQSDHRKSSVNLRVQVNSSRLRNEAHSGCLSTHPRCRSACHGPSLVAVYGGILTTYAAQCRFTSLYALLETRRITMPALPEISSDYPFEAHYTQVHSSRIHYIDDGSGDPILFLHGNPTWSYVWRNIIPHVTPFGRCIAPDLIGMGRSGKPDIEYRLVDQVRYVEGFIQQLGLKNITLVLHDWGSVIGFHYAMRHESNVKGLAFMEAALHPMPGWDDLPPENRAFFQTVKGPDSWDLIVNQNLFIEQLLQRLVLRQLTPEELTYYREPYLEPSSRKPLWRWPQEVSIGGDPADVQAILSAYSQRLPQSDLPKLLFYGSPGFILPAPLVSWCQQNLKNLTTVDIGLGNHVLQEENPHLIGSELAKWYHAL